MPECIQCGSFTRFKGGLCTKCYNVKKFPGKAMEVEVEDYPDKNYRGLNDKERNYRYGMIKGRIAETLIQELFLSLGYNVFRYGMKIQSLELWNFSKGCAPM